MYCTRLDLENRFGDSVIAGLEYDNPGAVEKAIAGVSSEIDSYVGARYGLPLAEIPEVLNKHALAMVRYELDIDPAEVIKERYQAAIAYLKSLASGKATLGIAQVEEPAANASAEIQSAGTVFGRADSQGFI
jgi:phage gp36-like protein